MSEMKKDKSGRLDTSQISSKSSRDASDMTAKGKRVYIRTFG